MSLKKLFQELTDIRQHFEDLAQEYGIPEYFRVGFLPGVSGNTYPLLNIQQNEDSIIVEALAPGLDPDSLKIRMVKNSLNISGEKTKTKAVPEDFHRCERASGKFSRTIEIPTDVVVEKVNAEYKNGIIIITLPKAESAKPRQIQVQVS